MAVKVFLGGRDVTDEVKPMRPTREHDYIVEIPEEVQSKDVVDRVRGYFRAEVQIIVCKDCGKREVGWRPVSARRKKAVKPRW